VVLSASPASLSAKRPKDVISEMKYEAEVTFPVAEMTQVVWQLDGEKKAHSWIRMTGM
jgi:hypothetical protein